MCPVAIPPWNVSGVLPPVNPASPTSSDRSPYTVALIDLVTRFSSSRKRMAILQSFLGFRAALHKIGLTKGFQWINGSFVEFIELIEGRPPVDIDVTTFYYLPEDVANQQQLFDLNRDVFDHAATKRIYNVDAYFVELNSSPLEPLIENVTYWNSLWSHRRIDLWKGYLQLDLAHDEDVTAGELLKGMMHQGGQA